MPTAEPKTIEILLFEDNAADANLVAEYLDLSMLNFSITTVKRMADGVEKLKKKRYDIILLDLSLPDSQGIHTLRTIMAAADDEVIIVLTGADDEELSLEALQVGAQDYLFKDRLNGEVLRRSIRYAIERSNLLRSLEANTAEIQYRESLLRRIFDANTDAMLILSCAYEIKFLNPAAGQLLEAQPNQLVGEIFPFEVKGGEITELEIPDYNDLTRIVELAAVDLIWEGESALLVILRDITQRKQAEIGLKREKERLAITLDSITDAVIATDQAGHIERLNQEATRLLGISSNEALDRPLAEVLKVKHPKTGKIIKDLTSAMIDPGLTGIATKLGLQLERADGNHLNVTLEMCEIRDEDGKQHGAITVLRDITWEKKKEKELFNAEKLNSISLLAGGIAHDFNNMLTAILGNISMVRIELDESHKHSLKLIAAEKAALQAKSLTQQLLTFSKGGAPILEVTTVSEMVEESAQFILRGSNVKCEVTMDPDLWPVDADKGQISQVVNNLIINADQAMPNGGNIHIRIRNLKVRPSEVPALSAGNYVCIEVRDNGTGISPSNLKRIFDPYFTTKEHGNGLGLASSYSIIHTHKGTITADSSLGHGSIFRVYLPKSVQQIDEQTNRTITTPAPPEETIHRGKGRILVMDDMEAMMMVAGEILTVLGYEVVYSTDGNEAITAYKAAKEANTPFDACVFDLTVPGGMGGEEAAKILLTYDPELIAIASSGYTTSDVMSNHKNSPFKAVVPKPYRIKEMSDALHSLLKSK
ncbi:response regulator [Coraliomargarita sp. SDUM461004]|uniref:histidine kinase n=1 Tax=Thalassobacterium sedimentorum TaxID=3041258 RepID=A0ABU1AMP0_9BACT|nr:response regulator [Coraliomargarita sp. SDUM461004]MDQ8194873.1 response regulator [Coraliomargarita sp. SDUM461004]